MKESILIPIKPKYVEQILLGKKTIEIRKTMPKCKLPIDVYIYCCKRKDFNETLSVAKIENRAQIVEDYGSLYIYGCDLGHPDYDVLNGLVVAKFTLNKVDYTSITVKYGQNITHEHFKDIDIYVPFEEVLPKTCLTEQELAKYEYTNHRFGVFAWHIDNLQIFDEPMTLSEFYKSNWEELIEKRDCNNCKYNDYDFEEHQMICGIDYDGTNCPFLKLNKAPQSWCYIQVNK